MEHIGVIVLVGKKWLTATGTVTDDRAEAVEFLFRREPNGLDHRKMDHLVRGYCGEIAGTDDLLGASYDRQLAITIAHECLDEMLVKMLWPDGKPTTTTDEEAAELDAKYDRAWREWDDPAYRKLRARWGTLQYESDEFQFWAKWEVLIISPPVEWDKVHMNPAYGRYSREIFRAFSQAFERASAGK